MKERIKDFAGNFYFEWICRKLKPEYDGPKQGNFLLLPPSDLDGSFGDELMVASFVANFAKKAQVTIFTDHLIRRDDFLSQYPQVKYQNGFQIRNYHRWADELKKATAVFIIGADALDGTYASRHSVRFFRLAQMALKMGKPVYFAGFSVSKKLTGAAKVEMEHIAPFSLLKARDLDSYKRLSSFISEDSLLQVSDMAFLCPYNKQVEERNDFQQFKIWIERQRKANRPILAYCPNSIQAEKLGWPRYLAGQKRLLKAFMQKSNVAILYLYHDARPLFDGKSDLDISRKLYQSHLEDEAPRVFFPEKVKNGVAVKSYLQYVDFTMTGRMHFGISGIAAGKPMFGICYANKFEGMLRLFDIDPTVSLVDYTEMETGEEIVDKFLNDIEKQYDHIGKNIEKVKQLALLNGQDIA